MLDELRDQAREGLKMRLEKFVFTPGMSEEEKEATATPYRDVAERLGMSETAVKVAAHRMRKRCGHILREEISFTVSSPDAVDAELRQLFAAVES